MESRSHMRPPMKKLKNVDPILKKSLSNSLQPLATKRRGAGGSKGKEWDHILEGGNPNCLWLTVF